MRSSPAAVRRFQRRHGLRQTGRVERSTYPALNMTAEERLAQLRLNLGRIRELMAQRTGIATSSSTFPPSSWRPWRTTRCSSGTA